MNIKGKLHEAFETVEIKEGFKKREFVVEYAENPQYPELLKFELIQANCEQLDDFKVGDEINVSFNLKGRKWTDPQGNVKYFNSLQAWRLEREQGATPPSDTKTAAPAADPDWMSQSFSEDDDLPF